MIEGALLALAALIRAGRAAALGTLQAGGPYVSLAPYAPRADLGEFYLHLSGLAVHTRNLRADPRAALLIAQADDGQADPQTLQRVSLQGAAHALARGDPDYAEARASYLAKFPEAAQTFALSDFDLYRFVPTEGRFVAAFGKIYNLTPADLRQAGSS